MPLTKDYFTLIDADCQHLFANKKWYCCISGREGQRKPYATGYVRSERKCGGSSIPLHRVITNCPPGKIVDHINGDTLDNRRENLRVCTYTDNNRNVRKSKLKGVVRCKPRTPNAKVRWRAYLHITEQGKKRFVHLGMHASPAEAAVAYNLAAVQYFGQFAALNDLSSLSASFTP